MNMRKHTLLLFLLLMAMPVLAENRSFRQAREIAEKTCCKEWSTYRAAIGKACQGAEQATINHQ